MTAYDYAELREAAINHMNDDKATDTARDLADWLEYYGEGRGWNGEWWDIEGYRLVPVYEEVEPDEWDLVRWEVQ